MASPLSNRLARNALWSFVAAVMSRGVAVLASVLVARTLGKNGLGEFGVLQNTVGMAGVFAGFGMGLTATKFTAELRSIDPRKAGRIMAMSIVMAWLAGGLMTVSLIVFAPQLALYGLAAPGLCNALRLASPLVVLGAVTGVQAGVLYGFEDFRIVAKINIISGLATFPLIICGVKLMGLAGAILGLVGSQLISTVLLHRSLVKKARENCICLTYRDCLIERRVVWEFSIPAAASSVLVAPVTWLANMIVVHHPGGYADMGIFNAANQWGNLVTFVPATLGQIWLPLLANVTGTGDAPRYKRTFKTAVTFHAVTAFCIAVPLCVAAPLILQSYGSDFGCGRWVLMWLCLSGVLASTARPFGFAIASRNRMWVGFWLNGLWGLGLLSSCLFLSGRFDGATGLAVSMVFAYFVHLYAEAIVVNKYMNNPLC